MARPTSAYDIRPGEESLVELENVGDHDDLGFSENEDFEVLVHKMAEGELLVTYSATTLKVGFHWFSCLKFFLPPSVGFQFPRRKTQFYHISGNTRHTIR